MPTPQGEERIKEFLFELRSVIDSGLDGTPLVEKDVNNEFGYEEEDVSMMVTMRWF